VFVAHAQGASRPEESGEYLRHGVALALGFGLIETIAAFALATKLQWFDQPAEVLALVNPFFVLISGSIAPVLVYLALRQYAEAMGRPWVPMLAMLATVALNVLLNWILIYGHWGAPALGLTGAGIATLISRVAGTWAIFEWVRRDAQLSAALPQRWFAPLSVGRLREMMRLGFPASGMLLFESGAFTGAAVMMGWLGAMPLAAHQIAITCASTTFMVLLGLSMAAGMRISAAVGAGEHERLRPIGYSALGLGATIAGACMIVFLVAGEMIGGWFVDDAAVIALAAQLLVVAGIFQWFDGGQVIAAALLRGLKDVKVPVVITFIAYWAIAMVGGYWLGIRGPLGAKGIWIGLAGGLAFAAVFLALRFRRLTR
jgi:MATE family multidrug resistance protein